MSPPARQGHELAVLLSVAGRIEPELVRAVRIVVAPLLDVSAEADLWFGNLVERRGYGYVSLRGDLLPSLRAELADRLVGAPPGAPVHRLWTVIERLHKDRSPALFAEERATWLAVLEGMGGDQAIERALRPALRALVEQGRDGVARWFAGAWPRLPEPVRRTTTAWQLATVTTARLAGVALRPEPPERLTVSDVGLIAARLPSTVLLVRRAGPDLLIGEQADATGGFTIAVPDTHPRVLDLLDEPLPRTLLVGRGERVTERVGWGPVRLLAADGAVYELPAPSPVSERRTRPRAVPGPDRQLTVAHTGAGRAWGTWVAEQAAEAGFGITTTAWQPAPDRPLRDALDELLESSGTTLLVLGDSDCGLGGRTDEEWNTALTEAAGGRLAAVLVGAGERPSAVEALPGIDLRGVDEREAVRRLFAFLRTSPDGAGAGAESADRGIPGPRYPGTAPAVSNAPPRNPRFTGREDLLSRIWQTLLIPGPEPGAADRHRCVLLGASGTGKTQTAMEYVHRYGNEYDVMWWISAGHQGTAREQLAELASRLGLTAGQATGNRIRAVQAALRVGQPYHRWLLVLDRADDVTEVEDLLPEGAGHILITSNSRAWADNERVHRIDVLPFSRAESIACLRGKALPLNLAEADLLAEAVQDLPLLVSHSAAWLAANPMAVADYLELVRNGYPGLPRQPVGVGGSVGYPRAVENSWSVTLASLHERHPAVVELLKLFTCFSPDAVPVRLLRTEQPAGLPARISALAADRQAWDEALRLLAETSVARLVTGDGGVEWAEMHHFHHALMRDGLSEDEHDTFSRVACDVLAAADPGAPLDTRTWSRYAELIPHLEISGALDSTRDPVSQLVLNCIEYLRNRGEARTGLRLCELTVARWHSRMPPDNREMLILTHQHANMLRRTGRYREAEAVGRAVVDRLSQSRPADDPELLRARTGLGGTLVALGAYGEARELYEDAVRGSTAGHGGGSTRQWQASRSDLANVLDLLGRYEGSLEVYVSTVSRLREEPGPNHFHLLFSELRCCWTLRLLGRYAEALAQQETNLSACHAAMGRYAVDSMVAEHNLALCLRRSGQLPQAERNMREVVDLARRLYGPRHPQALFVAADYASLLREHRDLDRSWTLADRVARDYADLLGNAHPFSVGTAGNVGLTLWESGDRDEALHIAERTLRGMTAAMGADHPWTLGCSLNLAGARSLVGDAEGAAGYSRDCMERSARAVGNAHPLTLMCKAALAADLRALRQTDAADRLEQETLGQLVEALGPNSPFTLAVRQGERPYWDFEPQPE